MAENPLHIDLKSEPLPENHPAAKALRPDHHRQKALDELSADPLLARAFGKTSRAKTNISENEERWDQESYEELLRQHPWMSRVTIRTHLAKTDPEGFAVGFFHLTPREIPPAISGPETINVITVPIIISDYKLCPFDVFAYKGAFYPLNEERATRLLRLRDSFTELDRAEVRRSLRQNDSYPISARDFLGLRAYDRIPSFKFASALDNPRVLPTAVKEVLTHSVSPELREKMRLLKSSALLDVSMRTRLADLASADGDWLKFLRGVSGNVTTPPVEKSSSGRETPDVLEAAADLRGLEVEVSSQATRMRPLWASSPETGEAALGEWRDVPLQKVAQSLGRERTQLLLDRGWIITNENTPREEEINAFEKMARVRKIQRAREFVEKVSKGAGGLGESLRMSGMDKESSVPAHAMTFINPKGVPGLPERFEGFIVNNALTADDDPTSMACCRVSRCHERCGILTKDGILVLGSQWQLEKLLAIDSGVPSSPPPVTEVYNLEWEHGSDNQCCVWEQDGYLMCIQYCDDKIELDGEVLYRCRISGGTDLVNVAGGMERLVKEARNEICVWHVPSRALCVRGSEITNKTEAPVVEELTEPEIDDSVAANLKVSHNEGLYQVEIDVPLPLATNNLDQRGMERALALAGYGEPAVHAVMKVAAAEGELHLRVPARPLGEGRVLYREVQRRVAEQEKKVMSAAQKVRVDHLPEVAKDLFVNSSAAKLSSMSVDASVDAILGLGFLSQENLLKFVDLLPEFETCLSNLCALLIASRLGMEEVPEESAEGAIRALEPIIKGLRIIEYSLIV